MSPITAEEKTRLAELETKIRGGLNTFVEVGNALNEISDARLYREDFGSFAEYVEFVWSMAPRTAYQMMDASQVVRNCAQSGTLVPENEAQCRELKVLPAAQQAEAFKAAFEATNGKPTAAAVKKIVHRFKFEEPPEHPIEAPKVKPISEARFESVVEKEMTRIADLLEQFPAHVEVIEENLRYLLGRCEEVKQQQAAA
jgi:hypothetical protein